MSMPLNRRAFRELIDGNIAWLMLQPDCLEREHTICCLRSYEALYKGGGEFSPPPPAGEARADDDDLPGSLALAIGIQKGEWPHTMDALVWATKWMEALQSKPDLATDEGAMLSWFANAIMAGWDQANAHPPAASGVPEEVWAWWRAEKAAAEADEALWKKYPNGSDEGGKADEEYEAVSALIDEARKAHDAAYAALSRLAEGK